MNSLRPSRYSDKKESGGVSTYWRFVQPSSRRQRAGDVDARTDAAGDADDCPHFPVAKLVMCAGSSQDFSDLQKVLRTRARWIDLQVALKGKAP
jgi:hypothetical protein